MHFSGDLKAEWKTRQGKAFMVFQSPKELIAIGCSRRIYNGQVD